MIVPERFAVVNDSVQALLPVLVIWIVFVARVPFSTSPQSMLAGVLIFTSWMPPVDGIIVM